MSISNTRRTSRRGNTAAVSAEINAATSNDVMTQFHQGSRSGDGENLVAVWGFGPIQFQMSTLHAPLEIRRDLSHKGKYRRSLNELP